MAPWLYNTIVGGSIAGSVLTCCLLVWGIHCCIVHAGRHARHQKLLLRLQAMPPPVALMLIEESKKLSGASIPVDADDDDDDPKLPQLKMAHHAMFEKAASRVSSLPSSSKSRATSGVESPVASRPPSMASRLSQLAKQTARSGKRASQRLSAALGGRALGGGPKRTIPEAGSRLGQLKSMFESESSSGGAGAKAPNASVGKLPQWKPTDSRVAAPFKVDVPVGLGDAPPRDTASDARETDTDSLLRGSAAPSISLQDASQVELTAAPPPAAMQRQASAVAAPAANRPPPSPPSNKAPARAVGFAPHSAEGFSRKPSFVPGNSRAMSALHLGAPPPPGRSLSQVANFNPTPPKKPQDKVAALLQWCQEIVNKPPYNLELPNYRAFADGLAFCALLHAYFPAAIPYHTLKAGWRDNNVEKNCKLAFHVAETHAGVMHLLDVEDMVALYPKPDNKSIILYVSFLQQELKDRISPLQLGMGGAPPSARGRCSSVVNAVISSRI